ncbi:MAG: D-alanyl-D-alanine carboxypeptidase [Coriobacteriales bacterium]|nr:D-alanyl-D-alanine carboxypeptidase [Coriobacteriales bacterium]
MAKNTKNTKGAKKARTAKKASEAQVPKRTQNNQQKTWQYFVRLVIIILLVLALGGSLCFGIIGSAYSLPLQTEARQGDVVDGQPAQVYEAVADGLPYVEAPKAALCTKEGRILFERNIDEQVTMASTTKMMTAIVALESTALDTPLTVTYGAANTDGTDAGLEEGMTLSLLDCLYALLLPSGNDAAVVIAENIADMEGRFVQLMNDKAAELGMASTLYADASGLSVENHYTTARDYLALARYCMGNSTFRQIVATSSYQADIGGRILTFATTDELDVYLTEGQAIGIKTGYTDEAGYCFIGAADAGGIELYTVVFNAPTAEQRFIDTADMLEWGFRHYRTIELINTSQQVADIALLSWIDETVAAYVPVAVRVEIFDLKGAISQEITTTDIEGEASKGQICGKIIWSQGEEVLIASDVVVAQTVLAPDFWEGLGIGWQRFWGGFSGSPSHAETAILLQNRLEVPAAQST